MDFAKYFAVLVILFPEGGDTGGHGEKHHDHVKLHIPEFVHHDHHTKVITIHHHHHKPKKEHHHHHHHHHVKPIPHIPHGHHYHHHKKAHTTSHTVSKGHNSHGHHGHHGQHGHHGHHGHHEKHGHHNHHGHGHYGHQHDAPSYSYEPPPVPSIGDDFAHSNTPSVSPYSSGVGPQIPQIHGVTHTVKQVKVYDSLPGVLPTNTGSNGYQVTENSEDTDDDVFTSVNSLQQTYPITFGYVRGIAAQSPSHENVAEFSPLTAMHDHETFAGVAQPTASFAGEESYTGTSQGVPFFPAAPVEYGGDPSHSSAEYQEFQNLDDGEANHLTDVGRDTGSFVDSEESFSGEVPVTFAREAGIQSNAKTEAVETVAY